MSIDNDQETRQDRPLTEIFTPQGKRVQWVERILSRLSITPALLDEITAENGSPDMTYEKVYYNLREQLSETAKPESVLKDLPPGDIRSSEAYLRLIEEQAGREFISYNELLAAAELPEAYKDQVEYIYLQGQTARYEAFLQALLQAGAVYNDLLTVGPELFYLPEAWTIAGRPKSKKEVISEAIGTAFSINELIPFRPSLREIAKEVQAPLSVIMDIYEEANGWEINE